jgi:hypothetical protein
MNVLIEKRREKNKKRKVCGGINLAKKTQIAWIYIYIMCREIFILILQNPAWRGSLFHEGQ